MFNCKNEAVRIKFDADLFCVASGSDPQLFVISETGSIMLLNFSDDSEQEIGRFKVTTVDVQSALCEGEQVVDIFETDDDVYEFWCALYKHDSGQFKKAALNAAGLSSPESINLLIIENLVLDMPYRKSGVSLEAVKTIIQARRCGVGLVAINPWPLQFIFDGSIQTDFEDGEGLFKESKLDINADWKGTICEATEKLCRYYRRAGFEKVKGTDVMVRNPLQPLFT
jgi:hypothetical protein